MHGPIQADCGDHRLHIACIAEIVEVEDNGSISISCTDISWDCYIMDLNDSQCKLRHTHINDRRIRRNIITPKSQPFDALLSA